MRKHLSFAFLNIGLLLLCFSTFAQQRQISGTILSDENKPLQGVTVTNRQTNQRTQTNSAGFYTISAQPGQRLVFTFVGYTTNEVTVGSSTTVNLSLANAEAQLGEVVVTALGI